MNIVHEPEASTSQTSAANSPLRFNIDFESPITMTGLYDSSKNRALATRCLSRIARSLEPHAEVHSEWWALDAFHHTSAHTRVVNSSERSMVLWFAGDGLPDQVDVLDEWLSECHWRIHAPRALVTVLDMARTKCSILERIQTMAASHNLKLFSSLETRSWADGHSTVSLTELVKPWPLHVPHALRPHQIRYQGINE